MPSITFDKISKSFGATRVIDEFTATVPDKEFLVLLGPSGCGKSTMLRMIAGLTEITSGELRFDDIIVNNLTPKKRSIAFVFQSYALYPHMSVRSNIAFPLVMDRFRWWHHIPIVGGFARRAIMHRSDVAAKVDDVAQMLELTQLLDRKPKALSGGQRQRVALARSLVREPSVYLLDEPLSNLDAKLRTQMRAEISALHARVQKTFVYVTHDQVEAMTMGTRIIVLNAGIVQQYGLPKDIYDRPANVFVAKFIGSPPMNLFPCEVCDAQLRIGEHLVPGTERLAEILASAGLTRATLGVRAENFAVQTSASTRGHPAHVAAVEHLGAETIVGFKMGPSDGPIDVGSAATRGLYYARLPGDISLALGQNIWMEPDITGAVLFDIDSGDRLDTDEEAHVTVATR